VSGPLNVSGLVAGARAGPVRDGARPRQLEPTPGRPHARIFLRQEETDEAVATLLRSVRQRFPWARPAQPARLEGNALRVDVTYQLAANPPLPEDETLSARLGPGVLYLRPVPRDTLGLAGLAAGGSYALEHVLESGALAPAGISVVTRGLPPHRSGFLAYARDVIHLPDIVVRGRVPRDAQALAQTVVATMDYVGGANRAILATAVLEKLGGLPGQGDDAASPRVTPAELAEVMAYLQRMNRLAAFLNLAAIPSFRDYLRRKEVDWSFIYANWRASVDDSGLFIAGFAIGAARNLTDAVVMLGTLMGAALSRIVGHPFLEELAADARQMWRGLGTLVEQPVVTVSAGVRSALAAMEEALWQLEFFEAGQILGNAVVLLLTLPEAVAALPKAARATLRGAVSLARLATRGLVRMGARFRDILTIMLAPIGHAVQTAAGELTRIADGAVLMSAAGGPLLLLPVASFMEDVNGVLGAARRADGVADLQHVLTDEVLAALEQAFDELAERQGSAGRPPTVFDEVGDAEIARRFDENFAPRLEAAASGAAAQPTAKKAPQTTAQKAAKRQPRKSGEMPPATLFQELEITVAKAIEAVRRRLGKQWLSNKVFGTVLHEELEAVLKRDWVDSALVKVSVERPLAQFPQVSAGIAAMTIKAWLAANPGYGIKEASLRAIFRDIDTQTIGKLRPDLILEADGLRIVWDLTSINAQNHLAKTLFYAAVLDDGTGITRVAESYWRHAKAGFDPAAFYGASGAAAALQKAGETASDAPPGDTPTGSQ
jgi:hypothetical protein